MAGSRLRAVLGDHGCTAGADAAGVDALGMSVTYADEAALLGAFRAMVRRREFDVCELALTTYLCARSFDKGFTALPVFPVRAFHHGAIFVPEPRPAALRGALEGRRVGVSRGYTVTTGVWARAILAEEHGIDLSAVTWARTGDEHVGEWVPPPNVTDLGEGADLAAELTAGRLAAVVGGRMAGPGIVPLYADPAAAGMAALARRGFYPINHCVVVRDDVLEARPDLAPALFALLSALKDRYLERLADGRAGNGPAEATYAAVTASGHDPLPYGIAPNRAVLDSLVGHAVAQGILAGPVGVESLFAEATAELVG